MLKIYYVFYQRIRFLLLSVGWTSTRQTATNLCCPYLVLVLAFLPSLIYLPKVQAAGKVAWTFSIFQFLTRSIKHLVIVTDRTFGSAELFGRTSTVRFGPNDITFFCRTLNLLIVLHSMPMASFHIFFCLMTHI